MKTNNIRFFSTLFALLIVMALVLTACDGKKTDSELKDDIPGTITDSKDETSVPDEESALPEAEEQTDGGEEEITHTEPEQTDDEDKIDFTKLPTLPDEIHTETFTGVTYLAADGSVAGGGTLNDKIELEYRLPDGVTCFAYKGDGESPDWGLALFKVGTEDDFAAEGYYVIENTVDDRFVGFGDVLSIKTYTLPGGYQVMEEKISYFEGGVGYFFHVRVDGEYIVRMSVAEANEDDVDLYRAVITSFKFITEAE